MPYSATKGLAERIVLEANGSELSTIALRPPFIWGEGAPSIGHIAHAFQKDASCGSVAASTPTAFATSTTSPAPSLAPWITARAGRPTSSPTMT